MQLKKAGKYFLIFVIGAILYGVTAVPVGLFIYTWKMQNGVNIFSATGFHSYMSCVIHEARRAKLNERMIEDSKFDKK